VSVTSLRSYLNSTLLPESVRRLAQGVVVEPPGPEWDPYLAKLRHHAHKMLDSDLDKLRAMGHSDDRIFEVTVSVAVEEGLRRLDAGLRAIDGAAR
jgi:hypothetical protein